MVNAVKLQVINNATKYMFDYGWPIQYPQQWTQTVPLLSSWVREISALQRDSSHRWYNLLEAAWSDVVYFQDEALFLPHDSHLVTAEPAV